MFKKILIANRGEIAIRIIRACKELGIATVAVHSTADTEALHVRFADQSVCIGPAQSGKSYLNEASIISSAEITGADAIHPGYGYLSENAAFASICESCKIRFIGPTPEHISMMGHKSTARTTAMSAGVPVIPGSKSTIDTIEEAIEIAESVGYPVMLKAASGGGGRGMRLLKSVDDLKASFDVVRAEADAAFSDPSVYIEKCIIDPKHIEMQIMADSYGNVLHLGERECSVQRRHQKLIEETPSINLPSETRAQMAEHSVNLAKAIGYESLGTLEYLYDQHTGNFYFIEMNTRIQVEHTVTECVTGLDLVKEQIRIAAGEKIRFSQEDVDAKTSGHSIECRINAEDPKTFMPSAGRVTELNLPGGPGIRVDTAIYNNAVVSPHYDSMIAKMIVHGIDRDEALAKMNRSLSEFHIGGIKTTIPLCLEVLNSESFLDGTYHTGSLEKMLAKDKISKP